MTTTAKVVASNKEVPATNKEVTTPVLKPTAKTLKLPWSGWKRKQNEQKKPNIRFLAFKSDTSGSVDCSKGSPLYRIYGHKSHGKRRKRS